MSADVWPHWDPGPRQEAPRALWPGNRLLRIVEMGVGQMDARRSRRQAGTTNRGTNVLNMLRTYIDHYHHRDEGATAVEYGIMVALIAIVIIAAVTLLGTNLSDTFDRVAESIPGEE